jgi:hypothetical protein
MLQCTRHIAVRWKATWFRQLNIVRTMPSPKTYTRAVEAAEAPQTSPYTATNVAPKSAENAQHLVKQAACTAQSAVQQAGQNLALARQLAGTAISSYQAVQSELAEHAQQAVQRTLDALTQASQVRSPTALLDLQSTYLTDNLQAVLATNARLAEIAAGIAQQAADKLQHRAA